METIVYKDFTIAYHKKGFGKIPIFLLHGFCEHHAIWDEMISEVSLEDITIFSIDLPGFGSSDVIPNITIPEYATIIVALMDYLSIEKVVVAGHSLGGYIALEMLSNYEDRLMGISIVNSHPYIDTDFKIQNRLKSIDFVQNNGSALFVKQMIASLFSDDFVLNNRHVVDKVTFWASQSKVDGIVMAQKAMIARKEHVHTLESTALPIQFILGLEDPLILEKDNIKQVTFPKIAAVHLMKNVAHMAMLEAPKKTGKAITDFARYLNACIID